MWWWSARKGRRKLCIGRVWGALWVRSSRGLKEEDKVTVGVDGVALLFRVGRG